MGNTPGAKIENNEGISVRFLLQLSPGQSVYPVHLTQTTPKDRCFIYFFKVYIFLTREYR